MCQVKIKTDQTMITFLGGMYVNILLFEEGVWFLFFTFWEWGIFSGKQNMYVIEYLI